MVIRDMYTTLVLMIYNYRGLKMNYKELFADAQLKLVEEDVRALALIDHPSLAVQLFAIKKWGWWAHMFLNEVSPEAYALLKTC